MIRSLAASSHSDAIKPSSHEIDPFVQPTMFRFVYTVSETHSTVSSENVSGVVILDCNHIEVCIMSSLCMASVG